MTELNLENVNRILIIKPSSFGDVIHALPVLNGLRQRFPDARIAWLVANSCAGLVEHHPALDEVIRFDRARYGRIGRSIRITGEFWKFVRSLREKSFDLVLDLQGLFRSGFLAWVCGATIRVGFGNARELAWLFYTHRISVPDPNIHAVDRNYLFADLLGFADVPIAFDLPVSEDAKQGVRDLLDAVGVRSDERYVVIAPGTRWETKIWSAERFATVARQIEQQHGLRVILVGTQSETPIAQRVATRADGRIVNLAGRTKLPELIALIDGSTGVIMHDSGPMHLALALGKPMVAIYGPTSPQLTGPYHRPDAIVQHKVDCSPCRIRNVADCPFRHHCLCDLSADTVLEKVSRMLSAQEAET